LGRGKVIPNSCLALPEMARIWKDGILCDEASASHVSVWTYRNLALLFRQREFYTVDYGLCTAGTR
jgi:hypothetical protein